MVISCLCSWLLTTVVFVQDTIGHLHPKRHMDTLRPSSTLTAWRSSHRKNTIPPLAMLEKSLKNRLHGPRIPTLLSDLVCVGKDLTMVVSWQRKGVEISELDVSYKHTPKEYLQYNDKFFCTTNNMVSLNPPGMRLDRKYVY